MIIKINNEIVVHKILDLFTPYLETLRTGKIEKDLLAKKLYENGICIVLYENREAVGFAAFYCNDYINGMAYLSLIAVKPEYGQKGYGRQLISEVKKISEKAGMKWIKLEVFKRNEIAVKFYKKQGFTFLEQKNSDSFFMKLNIEKEPEE